MRAVWIAGLLVLVALAGCADEASGDDGEDDDFNDREVKAGADQGVILGVVVDGSITPVAEATVTLTSTDPPREEATDDQGRFVFDELEPGAHFLQVEKELYESVQTSTDVVAGVDKPDILKVQLPKIFEGEPYIQEIPQKGFFTCSQANMPPFLYSSSSCHDNGVGNFVGGPAPSTDLSDYGVALEQERTFHLDISSGWQTAVFEMTWEPSARGTSERMGMVVSTDKETRCACHSFANVASSNPMRFQLEPDVQHDTAADEAPTAIPAEGWERVSYFMSVRPPAGTVCAVWCYPPGLALDQSFETFVHVFYYALAPDDWSIVNGDEPPF